MSYKIFVDTNILISGIFFEGNESAILDMPGIYLITCEDAVAELKHIAKKKFKYLKQRSLEIMLLEIDRALSDIEILPKEKYAKLLAKARGLISHKKDVPILAAALASRADYLFTGDSHFFVDKIRAAIKVRSAKEFIEEIRK